jgi:alpha-galactosidase
MGFEDEVRALIEKGPGELADPAWRFDAFENGKVLHGKRKNHLPAMGWNSWNAFGSGNTEKLTKAMADKLVELGLDKLGYVYVVLDDGCYQPFRKDGRIQNEEVKFPSGFRALADYLHDKGLKFGMYNDIGTNLCAGAAVGTCGHEKVDAQCYAEWGVDFLKVDNCYYLWDNATFSDAANARYVYAPNVKGIRLSKGAFSVELSAVKDGILWGERAEKKDTYVTCLGTFDGTGPFASPVGARSGELRFAVNVPEAGEYDLSVEYATGKEEGVGAWLQVAVGEIGSAELSFDGFVPETESPESFAFSAPIRVSLKAGENLIRIMNHRRQENTLHSYAAMLEGLNLAAPERDVILSICEWGKTHPQNWGYKVGDSWRILNDITFQVGSDGDAGRASWVSDYTTGVTAQYDKAVIMDEFAGLDKGWNDPDMMMIGMNGLTEVMNKTHFTMWSMMNSPLMLGMDLRNMEKGDALYNIVSNKAVIALNQDALGVQAKRVYASKMTDAYGKEGTRPDKTYIRDNDRVDILAKPLADGSVALSFINLSQEEKAEGYGVDKATILEYIGDKMVRRDAFEKASSYEVTDLWTGESARNESGKFEVKALAACDNVTVKVTPYA